MPLKTATVASDEAGSVSIIAAFTMPILIGFIALGAETGSVYMGQRKLQHAADMAAFAGAVRLMQGDAEDELKPGAIHVAQGTGYTAGEPGFVLNVPPSKGTYAGDADAVEVILTETRPRYLTALFGSSPFTIRGEAVAKYLWDGSAQACILALNTTAQTAVKALGNSAVNAKACDIASNSNALNSVNIDNVTSRCVYTVGEGSATRSSIGCGGVQAEARAVRDPYAGRQLPPMDAACTIGGNKTYPAGNASAVNYKHPTGCSYSVFDGNVTFQKNVNLAPGYYVFRKKFTVDPSNSPPTTINGAGVTLIFLGSGNNDLSTSGNGVWKISAPTSGPTAGIAIWIPGSSPITSVNFNASASSTFTGAIYAPQVDLTMNGGSSNTSLAGGGCTQIIAGTVNINGGGTYNATAAGCKGTGTEAVRTNESVALVD